MEVLTGFAKIPCVGGTRQVTESCGAYVRCSAWHLSQEGAVHNGSGKSDCDNGDRSKERKDKKL